MQFPQIFQNTHLELQNEFIKKQNLSISGISNISAKVFLLNDILQKQVKNLFYICTDSKQQAEIIKDLKFWNLGQVHAIHTNQNSLEQNQVIQKIYANLPIRQIFVLTKKALEIEFPNFTEFQKHTLTLKTGTNADLMTYLEKIVTLGYSASENIIPLEGEYKKPRVRNSN